jgi:hypothetical protein
MTETPTQPRRGEISSFWLFAEVFWKLEAVFGWGVLLKGDAGGSLEGDLHVVAGRSLGDVQSSLKKFLPQMTHSTPPPPANFPTILPPKVKAKRSSLLWHRAANYANLWFFSNPCPEKNRRITQKTIGLGENFPPELSHL